MQVLGDFDGLDTLQIAWQLISQRDSRSISQKKALEISTSISKFQDQFHFPQDLFHGFRIHFLLHGICFHEGSWVDLGRSGLDPWILDTGVADLLKQCLFDLQQVLISFVDMLTFRNVLELQVIWFAGPGSS
jgi:hypothetical protein